MSGRGGTIARNDAYEDVARFARRVAGHHPATRWERVVDYDGADLLEFVANGRVLVGTVTVDASLGVPSHGAIELVDATTGGVIWSAPRPSLVPGSYAVLAIAPRILLAGVDGGRVQFTALDPATGATAWEHAVSGGAQFAFSAERERLVVVRSDDSRPAIYAIDSSDGAVAWRQDALPPGSRDPGGATDLRVVDGEPVLVGTRLVGLTATDGQVRWQSEELPAAAAGRVVVPSAVGLLVAGGAAILLIDPATGRTRWRRANPDAATKVVAAGSRQVFLVAGQTGAEGDRVHALDPGSGKVAWSRDAGGKVVSRLLVSAGGLVFTTPTGLTRLDANSGAVRFQSPLPAAFARANPLQKGILALPDVLSERAGKIVLAREYAGVAAYGSERGELAWQQAIQPGTMHDYGASQRLLGMLVVLQQNGLTITEEMAAAMDSSLIDRYPSAQLQGVQAAVLGGVEEQFRREQWRTPRFYVHRHELGHHWMHQFQGSRGVYNAAADVAIAVERGMRKQATRGLIHRELLQIQAAMRAHRRCFRGDYFVRPFFCEEGRGVTLVDLRSGHRADLVFAPPVNPLKQYSVDLLSVAVAPVGDQLVTTGVGLDATRYQEHVKWKWRLPKPSLLAYAVGSLRFGSEDQLQQRLQRQKLLSDTTPQALRAQAAAGNLQAVQLLLDAGVDVNAPEPKQKLTALMMAAMQGRDAVVLLLLSKGAAVDAVNVHGQTALDLSSDPNLQIALGRTSAEDQARYQRIAQALLKAGARPARAGGPQISPEQRQSAFRMWASALHGKVDVVRELLAQGVEVDWRNPAVSNSTALIMAAIRQDEPMVRLLLQHRADPTLENDDGESALQLARRARNQALIRMLEGARR